VRRWVFHVDLDEFIAAVEILRRPELESVPVVVGGDGDPSKRGVVSTANYVARRFGVRSGMPLRTAYARCPEAVFLAVDAETYLAASREVMDVLRTFPAVVQVAGWDEAFLDVETEQPEVLARAIQAKVLEQTRLWCSIGVGDNKLRAKIASGFAKPRGIFRLTEDHWRAAMGFRPTSELWGIGTKTAAKLAAIGIRTVDDLADAGDEVLARAFGPHNGPWLRALANGEDDSPVTDEPYVPRGPRPERTFPRDSPIRRDPRSDLETRARGRTARGRASDRAGDRGAVRAVHEHARRRAVEPSSEPEGRSRRRPRASALQLGRPCGSSGARVRETEIGQRRSIAGASTWWRP
jgi:DNA polymerase-4